MISEANPKIARAYETLQTMSQDDETRRRYEAREAYLLDRVLMIEAAEEKGREEGREKGKRKGEGRGSRKYCPETLCTWHGRFCYPQGNRYGAEDLGYHKETVNVSVIFLVFWQIIRQKEYNLNNLICTNVHKLA